MQRAVIVLALQMDIKDTSDVLTAKHIKDWRTNGFLILRAAEWLSPQEQKNMLIWMEEVIQQLQWVGSVRRTLLFTGAELA